MITKCDKCGSTNLLHEGYIKWYSDPSKPNEVTPRSTTCKQCGKSWLHLPEKVEE